MINSPSFKSNLAITLVLAGVLNARSQDLQLLIGSEDTTWSTASSGPVLAADGSCFLRLRIQDQHSLIKLDAAGNITWHRRHAFPDGSNAFSPGIVPTSDGGAYLLKSLMVEDHIGRFTVTRIATDGATSWSNLYSTPLAPTLDVGGTEPLAVIRPDGGLDIFVRMNLSGMDEFFLMRLGNDGSVIWTKRAAVVANTTVDPVWHVSHDGLGGLVTFYEHNGLRSGLVSRFDGQGEHLWSRSVAMTNQWWNYENPSIVAGTQGEVYVFGSQDVIGSESNYIFKLDPDGELAWYRWIDQGWPMLPIYSQVGRQVNGQLQFGGSTQLVLDTEGIPVSMNRVSFPATQAGAFEWRVVPAVPHRPSDRLLVGGSWLRRDVTFGAEWRTPVYMNMSFDPEEWCQLDFSSDLPEHLIVPTEYVENLEQPAWTNATTTVAPVTILDTPLALPIITPLCLQLGVEEVQDASPGMRLQPNLVGSAGTCELLLHVPGTYRIYTATGVEVARHLKPAEQHVISTDGLHPGCYLVRAQDRQGRPIGTDRLLIE